MTHDWPNVFVVGAAKAGTTTLCDTLASHPDVTLCRVKEPHFFSCVQPSSAGMSYLPVVRDPNQYRRLYAGSRTRYVLDGSTSYLWDRRAATRIADVRPDARIIVSLRN